MKKVCCILTYPAWTAMASLLLAGCGEMDGGLKQRIAESDAQRVIAETRVKDLEKQLEALRQQNAGAPAPAPERPPEKPSGPADDAMLAALGTAAGDVQRKLESSIVPDKLLVYRHAAWAGFYAERADGNGQGVAVPFFSEDGIQWKCGWSPEQIKTMLLSTTPVPAIPQPTGATETPPSTPVETPPASPASSAPAVAATPPKTGSPAGNVEIVEGEDGVFLEITTLPDGKKRVRPVLRK
jgi:hypothetical protein